MKKFAALLAAVTVLFSAAFAENLSAMTDEELLALHEAVLDEMTQRGFPTGGSADAAEEDVPVSREETVFFYQPDGGEYYHLDRNCRRVHPKFLPLSDSLTYAQLNEAPYRDLKPCEVCGADAVVSAEPAVEKDPSSFETFSDAMVSMDEGDAYTVWDGYAVAAVQRDGRVFRVVAALDERAEELYAVSLEDEDESHSSTLALYNYVKALPVQYTEELSVVPFTQEELDAMAGKTIEDVMSEPWELGMCYYPDDAEAGKDVVFPMVKGFCEYELVINEPFEVYQERRAADRYDPVTAMSLRNYLDLTVKCVRYTGYSPFNALDLRFRADGTVNRDTIPEPEGYDYDLMVKIADYLADTWANAEPDQAEKEAIITQLTEEHPESENMIRQIVESFH